MRNGLIFATTFALFGCTGGLYMPPTGSGGSNGSGGSGGTVGSGGSGGSGGATMTPQAYFENNVSPIFLSKCSSCHMGSGTDANGPNWLGPSETAFYVSVKMDTRFYTPSAPASSLLITKGQHEGPALLAGEAQAIQSWLALEASPGGGTGGSGGSGGTGGTGGTGGAPGPTHPTSIQDALQLFARCMTTADFQTYNVANVANQTTTEGPCYSCHTTGTGAAFLSQTGNDIITNWKNYPAMPYVLKIATGTVNPDGTFKDLVPANRFRDKGQENDGTHPQYILSTTRQQAMDQFFQATYQKYSTGNCP